MTKCRRCHRNITNPASVRHGFGHVCWNKLEKQDYSERPASLRITIIDQAEAQKSLAKIREQARSAERQTCKCGEPLNPANVEYYDHEGGYDLLGFGKPQWLYHHCDKCNFDYSLWKLRIPDAPSPPKAILGTPGERVALLKAGMPGKAIEQEYVKANNFKIVNMLLPTVG